MDSKADCSRLWPRIAEMRLVRLGGGIIILGTYAHQGRLLLHLLRLLVRRFRVVVYTHLHLIVHVE